MFDNNNYLSENTKLKEAIKSILTKLDNKD